MSAGTNKKINILFICSANRCRSAMAEGIAEKSAKNAKKNYRISSAGTLGLVGEPPTQLAIEVAQAHDVDISQQRSAEVSDYMLGQNDFVFTMTHSHKNYIKNNFPNHIGKCFLLAKFGRGREQIKQEVEDPVGTSYQFYEQTFTQLSTEIQRIMEFLDGKN